MIILMYVMNYLDRNNIAAVRLAGLQAELDLSSTQYQVRWTPLILMKIPGLTWARLWYPSFLLDI
jgi:hypothetical protein